MADSIERIAEDCAWESHRLRNSGAELADYEAWERIATRLRALSPAGGPELADVERRFLSVRDMLPGDYITGYTEALAHIRAAMLAASPQPQPTPTGADIVGIASIPPGGDGATTRALFDARTVPAGTKLYTSGQTPTGAGGDNTRPHPRWNADKPGERHPQTVEAWDWTKDSPDNGGGLERSRLRLNVAADFVDPRAADQMAMVLRIDLIRTLSALTWRTTQVKNQSATSAGTTGDSEDAARYRWLRGPSVALEYLFEELPNEDGFRLLSGEELDAAIDAARRAREVGNG